MKLSIVMPVFNEEKTIREIVSRVLQVDLGAIEKELIVVDDCSRDGTRDIIMRLASEHACLKVVFQPQNRGKGAAVAAGIRAASGDLLVIQDADLEYDPAEYPVLLRPVLSGDADVVYGSRFMGGAAGGRRVLYFWHSIGNKFLTLFSNAFTDLNLTDMETCYKLMKRDIAERLDLRSRRFGIEPEITCKIARMGARIYEVPISYHGRTYSEGKKIGWRDAVTALLTILRFARWEAPKHDVGAITLRRMARLSDYNHWLHGRFEPYLGSRILEVGSGVGNQTQYFAHSERVVASDIEPHYVRELTAKFGRRPHIRIASYRFPLTGDSRAELQQERLDTIVCLNVLEHIEQDRETLKDFAGILPVGGHLVLLVPAMPALYGTLDINLNHFRRYDREGLKALVSAAGFEVDTIRYLNRPGVVGWWVNSRVLHRRVLPRRQLAMFRWLKPLLRLEENTEPSFGMSLLVLARRA